MKKFAAILLSVGILASFSACGAQQRASSSPAAPSSQAEEQISTEKAFFSDLKTALQARWEKQNGQTQEQWNAMSIQERATYTKGYLNEELSRVKKYETEAFSDEKLGGLVKQYLEGLQTFIASFDYTDVLQHNRAYEEGSDNRAMAIKHFVDDYGFTVDESHKNSLNNVCEDALSALGRADTKQKISEMIDSVHFETESTDTWKTYEAVVENTSGQTFSYIQLQIKLLDEDGVIVDTDSTNLIQNWKAGEKAKFSFSSGKAFASMQVDAKYTVQ